MNSVTTLTPVKTPSLIVREISVSDVKGFADYMVGDRYQRYLSARHTGEASVRAFVNRAVSRQDVADRSRYDVAAQCRLTGNLRGDGFIIFHDTKTAELGWGVNPLLWNKGLGTEIAQALAAIAIERLGASTVWCKVMGPNMSSRRVARKAGLKHDRTVCGIDSGATGGTPVHIFTISANDYFEQGY